MNYYEHYMLTSDVDFVGAGETFDKVLFPW